MLLTDGHPVAVTVPPPLKVPTEVKSSVWILLRAFASGCDVHDGRRGAVSNGVPPLQEAHGAAGAAPRSPSSCAILVALLGGIAYLSRVYGIGATDPGADGLPEHPLHARRRGDRWGAARSTTSPSAPSSACSPSRPTPASPTSRGSAACSPRDPLPPRLVRRARAAPRVHPGILALSVLSAALLVAFGGVTDRLIPLFAIGAFLAFTMSQAGMVQHWRRIGGPEARHSLPINAVGAVATAVTLVVVAVSKFTEGAWLTVLVIPLLMFAFVRVNRHYRSVAAQIVTAEPLALAERAAPIAVVAMQSWNKLTVRGLQFAVRFAPEVYAVQAEERDGQDARPHRRLGAARGRARPLGRADHAQAGGAGVELPPVLQAAHRLRDRAARPEPGARRGGGHPRPGGGALVSGASPPQQPGDHHCARCSASAAAST